MRLLVLLLVGIAGVVVSSWGAGRGGRAGRVGAALGMLALVAFTVGAFLLREKLRLTDTGQPVSGAFDAHLVHSAYLRLVIGLWGLESVIIVFAAWVLGGLERLRGLLPATLAALTGGTVALASADLAVGAAAAAATGLASMLIILAVGGSPAVAAGARELRVTLVTGAVVIVAMAIVPLAARLAFIASGIGLDQVTEGASTVAGPALGMLTVAVGLAFAARWGMPPFHIRLSRLADLVPPDTLPLLVAWIPVPLTVVVFAAVDRLIAPLELPADGERVLLVGLALVTFAGAALAAVFQDDLRHAAGYLVVADSGLLLLALAALDLEAWGPGRAWVVVLAASKTALFAWAAVVEDRFETRSIPDLRGWMRRSPLLAVALALVAVATYGLPGWVALDTRVDLAAGGAWDAPGGAWGSPWREILLVAGFLTLPSYLRLAKVGLGRPTTLVERAAPERIIRRRRALETLVVEQELTDGYAIVGGAPRTGRDMVASVARDAVDGARHAVDGARHAVDGARHVVGDARHAVGGAASSVRGAVSRDRAERVTPAELGVAGDAEAAPTPGIAGREPAAGSSGTRTAGRSGRSRQLASPGFVGRAAAAIERIVARDRTELLSGAVLALAILAALTSWGSLDIAGAAAEPAPIILGTNAD